MRNRRNVEIRGNAPANVRDPRAKRRRVIGLAEGNPALIRGAVVAILALLATLGFGWAADVDRDTITAVAAVISFLAPLIGALLTRPAVTPNPKVVARVTTGGDVVAGDASEITTGATLRLVDAGSKVLQPIPIRAGLLASDGE